ncbi:hypothetical protein EVB81_177 [Rhizobium phage RHph_I46]|uniref:Uncharacterized protein n=1 Tax=Rhizobium phage RHph_I1_9 TaxID=2509729 RepID=A0A7S5UZP2_9CAUD|nr:hypothetical protein PP936_gp176 [Rhizobium phage RHph_I1_9]QIG69746.1 hypothetical protein EVB81_177 [Rhizobium phage RHph_I46]QIG71027.1 hypothetical protein EVB92_177 [Rhizobium phage RHph_I9]QIG73613.1 hypothetical protein EVC04_176 [Rhizobium phage RHph_I1_9]QIG76366.1 hypothetical protein EVC25_177 [Rhizobium phage RHph_I34]
MAVFEFWDFYRKLVETSEKRSKADPRTQWYLPRNSEIKEFLDKSTIGYLYVDARNVPFNKCKEMIENSKEEKVAIHTYFDKTASTLLANAARLKGCKVVIEFCEHASEA